MGIYTHSYQGQFLSIFYGTGSNPLNMWDFHIQNGYMKRYLDPQLRSVVLELRGLNVSTSYMICPKDNKSLGIVHPFLIMLVKNLHKYFSFEITIRDSEGFRRRIRASNFQSCTKITPMCVAIPIGLSEGWNQIQLNLADFVERAYNKHFTEVVSLKINANLCVRRVYFAKSLVPEDELPKEYRLFCNAIKPSKVEEESEVKADIEEKEEETVKEEEQPEYQHPAFTYRRRSS